MATIAPINLTGQVTFNTAPTAAMNATFAGNYKILFDIGRRQRLALLLNALIMRSGSVGGLNYNTKHAQLFTDSKLYTRGISNMDPITMLTAIWEQVSINAYSVAADIQAQMSTMSDFENLSEDELWRMIALVTAGAGA
jgi:hypothetical protein